MRRTAGALVGGWIGALAAIRWSVRNDGGWAPDLVLLVPFVIIGTAAGVTLTPRRYDR